MVEPSDWNWEEDAEIPPVRPEAGQVVILGRRDIGADCWVLLDRSLVGPLVPGGWTVGEAEPGERELRVAWPDRVASYTVELHGGERVWFVLSRGGDYEFLRDEAFALLLFAGSERVLMATDAARVADIERAIQRHRAGTVVESVTTTVGGVLAVLAAPALLALGMVKGYGYMTSGISEDPVARP